MALICRSTSLFLWHNLISRRSLITTIKRHSPPKKKRQLKPQTNKKKTNDFLTNHQSKTIKLFFNKKTPAISHGTIILLSLFNLHLFNITFHQNKPSKCQNNNISSCYNFTSYCSIYICSILRLINVYRYFQFNVLNIKVKSKICISFIFYSVKY